MSDVPVSAPPAPAAAPSAAPAPAAPTGPQAPHHAHLQPREQGKFAGPPDLTKTPAPVAGAAAPEAPPAPKKYRVGEREFTNPDDLSTYAAERDAEARALDTFRKQAATDAKRAAELEAKLKDPRTLITPELRKEIMAQELREFQEAEYVRSLPEDQRRLYLYAKQVEQEKRALEAEKAERTRVETEAKQKADAEAQQKVDAEQREEMKAVISGALQQAGLEPTWRNVQRAANIMGGAALRGVTYPPEVIAKKVREDFDEEHRSATTALPVDRLLSLPGLLEKLNAVDDAALLRKLAPLGEKLRRLNLESLGARPAPAPEPVVTGAGPSPTRERPPSGSPEWEKIFRERAKGGR